MKIGIMTFWWSNDNYGQLLQCYALQRYLRDAGHDAYLIRYRSTVSTPLWKKILKGLNPYLLLRHMKHTIRTKKIAKEEKNNNRHFDDFRSKYIVQSKILYSSYQELKQNPPEADVYVVGSDQVWNFSFYGSDFKHKRPGIHAYMLDFGSPNTKRISYAASWSVSSLDKRLVEEIRPLLAKFDVVSVREEQGLDLCRQCGRNDAQWVCDPTLLLDAQVYRNLYQQEVPANLIKGKYLFLYMLNNKCNFNIENIFDFAQKKGLQVVYVTGNGVIDKKQKYFATIPEWLHLVDNATYVVTNSFHCCVFSLLFQKQFGVVPLSGKFAGMNSRLDSLFGQFEIEKRWLSVNNLETLLVHGKYKIKNNDFIDVLKMINFSVREYL